MRVVFGSRAALVNNDSLGKHIQICTASPLPQPVETAAEYSLKCHYHQYARPSANFGPTERQASSRACERAACRFARTGAPGKLHETAGKSSGLARQRN